MTDKKQMAFEASLYSHKLDKRALEKNNLGNYVFMQTRVNWEVFQVGWDEAIKATKRRRLR